MWQKVPQVVLDPEHVSSSNSEFNRAGIQHTSELWVAHDQWLFRESVETARGSGRLKNQPESPRGLAYPTETACLDAMEEYARALDPWNYPCLLGEGEPYGPRAFQRWRAPPAREQAIEAYAAAKGWDNDTIDRKLAKKYRSKVTGFLIERQFDRLVVHAQWKERLPPKWKWSNVVWIHESQTLSERVYEFTARRLVIHWGAPSQRERKEHGFDRALSAAIQAMMVNSEVEEGMVVAVANEPVRAAFLEFIYT